MADPRIVCGSRCTWWDSIAKIGRTPKSPAGVSLPACPHCGNVLFEYPDEQTWWRAVDKYERERPSPGYRKFMEWARGKCFPTHATAMAAYEARDA